MVYHPLVVVRSLGFNLQADAIAGRGGVSEICGAAKVTPERVVVFPDTSSIVVFGVSETTVGERPAIVPAIRGSAFVTGRTELYVDDRDPFPEGYLLTDTWPGDDTQS